MEAVTTPASALWLWRSFGTSVKRPDQSTLLPQQVRLRKALELTTILCKPLLAATSPDELDDRLDEIIEESEWYRRQALLGELIAECQVAGVSFGLDLPTLDSILGDGFRGMIAEFNGLADALGAGIDKLLMAHPNVLQQGAAEFAKRSPLFFLSDLRMPAVLAQALVASFRAMAGVFAIIQVQLTRQIPPVWLTWELLERMISGGRQHLRIIASLPGSSVPDDLVPPSERFDVALLDAQAREAAQGVELLRQEALQSGARIYPPLADSDYE